MNIRPNELCPSCQQLPEDCGCYDDEEIVVEPDEDDPDLAEFEFIDQKAVPLSQLLNSIK